MHRTPTDPTQPVHEQAHPRIYTRDPSAVVVIGTLGTVACVSSNAGSQSQYRWMDYMIVAMRCAANICRTKAGESPFGTSGPTASDCLRMLLCFHRSAS